VDVVDREEEEDYVGALATKTLAHLRDGVRDGVEGVGATGKTGPPHGRRRVD